MIGVLCALTKRYNHYHHHSKVIWPIKRIPYKMLNRLKDGIKTIKSRLELDQEEEENDENLSEEEDDIFNFFKRKKNDNHNPNPDKTNAKIADVDIDIDLSDEFYDNESDERKKMKQYFNAIKKIDDLFPSYDFLKNPEQIENAINELNKNILSLNSEQESLRVLLDNGLTLKSVMADIEKEERHREEAIDNIQFLIEQLANTNDVSIKQTIDLPSAIKENGEAEKNVNLITMEIDQIKSSIEKTKQNIKQYSDENEDLEDQLEEERYKYSQLLQELSSFQETTKDFNENRNSNFESKEVNDLEEELNSMKQELEKLKPKNDIKQTISTLESELQKLTEKYQQVCDNNESLNTEIKGEMEYDSSNDERINITSLLLKYYKGDKNVVNQLKTIFEWTQEELDLLKPENRGLSKFLRKGASYFNRFAENWTSWLLQAAESD